MWIPPLVYCVPHRVNRRPAVLHLTGAWWALVFPLGMYSVATGAMATELRASALETVSLVFFWNALTAWVIVAVAGVLRARAVSFAALQRRGGPERSAGPKPTSRARRGR